MAVISPLICGVLIDINWRLIHYCSAGFYVLTIFMTIPFENTERTHFKHLDWLGTLMLFVSIILIDLSFTIISAQGYIIGVVVLVAGIGLFVGLVYVEKCQVTPVLPINLLRKPVIDYVLANIMNNYVCSMVSYLIPQEFKHYD